MATASKAIGIRVGFAAIAVLLVGFAGWILSLPSATSAAIAPPVPPEEADAIVASLRPGADERPLIAVVGINDATEITDYLIPTGILRRSNIADVVMLATAPGPVQLYPALRVKPDATIAEFDAAHPKGANYIVVPAMSRDDDPAVLAWLRRQVQRGATVIGVCAGAKVVGASGLLDGRRATTHWYYLDELLKRSPEINYVANRRMVVDGNVATTTGITASMPTMLTLIEAIAGRAKAGSIAKDLGLEAWDARHASGAFRMTRAFVTTVLFNRAAVWNHEELGTRLEPGMDEVSLALLIDAWSRTYRSSVVTYASSLSAIATAHGIHVLPDRKTAVWPEERRVSTHPGMRPADTLNHTLDAITERYGEPTTNVVAMQLEYLRPHGSR